MFLDEGTSGEVGLNVCIDEVRDESEEWRDQEHKIGHHGMEEMSRTFLQKSAMDPFFWSLMD
jgi:hypothetical protein